MENNNFAVYSRDGCPYCDKIIKVLELSKLNYVVYKAEIDFNKEGFFGQFGEGATFPQVVLNEKNLGGVKETIQYLKDRYLI